MHNQFIASEVESVGFSFPRVVDHLLLELWLDRRKIVNFFPGIYALWDAERQAEFVGLDELVFEVVSLDDSEILQGLIVRDLEFQEGSHLLELQEFRGEIVANRPVLRQLIFVEERVVKHELGVWIWSSLHLEEHLVGLHSSNTEL